MNPSHENETDAIRSDIDVTRRRMDDTMDALGDKLQPRHLLDEVVGMFRGNSENGENKLTDLRQKLTHSADSAMHAVVDAVKHNPMPALLIGAGVAWMIYESRRNKLPDSPDGNYYGFDREGDALRYDPDTHYDRPLEYPTADSNGEAFNGGALSAPTENKESLGEKAAHATDQLKNKLSHVGEAAREKASALRERAGEKLHAVRQRTGEMCVKTRDRVVTTAEQHPLEVGLVALAAGLLAGLALPTPNAINRKVGPTAEKLRQRTRQAGGEMLEKGKRVAEAAVSAVQDEAQAQGITPEFLREKSSALAGRTKDTIADKAKQEGFTVDGNSTSSQTNDSSSARPAV